MNRQTMLSAEEQARADWYAFLARIWYAAPDDALLQAMVSADEIVAETDEAPLEKAWRQLAQAARLMDAQSAKLEYDSVFIGIGKAPVTPYMAHYLPGTTGKEKHVLRLRQLLDELGLARVERVHEPEDHLAALCEIMRHLILAGGAEQTTLARQSEVFKRYLVPGYEAFVAAVLNSEQTNFYKNVARFTKAFFDIEVQSFEMS